MDNRKRLAVTAIFICLSIIATGLFGSAIMTPPAWAEDVGSIILPDPCPPPSGEDTQPDTTSTNNEQDP